MNVSVPTSLKDIKLKAYQDYQKELQRLDSRGATEVDLMNSKISTICGISLQDVLNIEMVDIWKISRLIDDVLRLEPDLTEKFTVKDLKFGWLPNLDTMKWGEFLDLNDNISNGETMHIAMGVLYRPILQEDKKGRYDVEKYEGDKYHEHLKEMTLEAVVGSMVFFLEFRNGLCDSYHQVFGRQGDEVQESTEFSREWGWFATVDELSLGDVTKIEEVINLPMHLCLKKLCYNIDKAKKDQQELEKIKRRNGSR